MMTEATELIGLEVYTDRGYLLGTVEDVVIDTDTQTIYGLYIGKTNPLLVEDGVAVLVPYRWVKAVGDVILLRRFPSQITISSSPP